MISDFDFIPLGDSLTSDSYPSNAFRFSGPLATAPGCLVYNAGVPNETVAEIAARISADVVAKMRSGRDTAVIVRAGTNGPGGSGNFTTEYTALVNALTAEAQIKKVILLAIPPKGLSGNGATFTSQNAVIAGLAGGKVSYIADSAGLGDGSYNADPAYYISSESANPIHMNAVGAYTQALVQAAAFPGILGAVVDPRVTTGQNYRDNGADQWVNNPLMAGSGTATDWSTSVSSGSVTPSIVAGSGSGPDANPWQRMTISSLGSGAQAYITTALGHPAISSGGFPARLEFVCDIRFNSLDCANLDRLTIFLQNGGGTKPMADWKMQLAGIGTVSHTMRIRQAIPRDTAASYTANSLTLYFELQAIGSTGSIGSIDVRNVSITALGS